MKAEPLFGIMINLLNQEESVPPNDRTLRSSEVSFFFHLHLSSPISTIENTH